MPDDIHPVFNKMKICIIGGAVNDLVIKSQDKSFDLPITENGPISNVPSEILVKIFKRLEKKDLQSATTVNSFWKIVAIYTAKHKEILLRKNFVDFLTKNLKSTKDCFDYKEEKAFSSLKKVQSFVEDLDEKIANELKNLPNEEWKKLEEFPEEKCNSEFFKRNLDIAKIYKKIDETNTKSNGIIKFNDLRGFSSKLFDLGKIKQAIKIANTISDEYFKSTALEVIVKKFLKRNKIKQAIKIANTIPSDEYHQQSCAFEEIVNTYIKQNKIKQAIKIRKAFMNNKIDFSELSIEELAAIVSMKLKEYGIDSVLVGGACVSIYSQNRYQSYDLDFITYEDMKKVTKALKELNFQKNSKYFSHKNCKYFIEFVSPPVSIGDEPIHHFESHQTSLGTIKMLTPTDSVKDRLASFFHWDDKQGLDQAIAICKEIHKKIDMEKIKRWSIKEGHYQKFRVFLKLISKVSIPKMIQS